MSSNSSPLVPLALATLIAVGVGYGVHTLGDKEADKPVAGTTDAAQVSPERWVASAAGRIEAKGGEIKLAVTQPGRITDVLVKPNAIVKAGDLLVKTEDRDAYARLQGADAEAGVRKRERDTETNVPQLVLDRRKAEDRLNETERAIATAHRQLDRLFERRAADENAVTDQQIETQRTVLKDAVARMTADRLALHSAQIAKGVALPTRLEAGLTAARSELTVAEQGLERTRLRSPIDGTILQVTAKTGELAAATPEQVLVTVADLSALKARIEVEERFVSKIVVGQDVVLKVDAYAGKEFTGKVARIAKAMRAPSIATKGPRRPNDLDVLEVTVNVTGDSTGLMPGMRADAFFKDIPAAKAAKTAQTETAKASGNTSVSAQGGVSAAGVSKKN
ncbi:MAG: HlyD family secretion protein [Hyphomicrobiaceae bacterium]